MPNGIRPSDSPTARNNPLPVIDKIVERRTMLWSYGYTRIMGFSFKKYYINPLKDKA